MNRKQILKLIISGIIFMLVTILIQGFISPVLMGMKSTSTAAVENFGLKISPILFLNGITYAIFYCLFNRNLPGKSSLAKGFYYGVLAYFSNYLPQVLGTVGLSYDGSGLAVLYKGIDAVTWINDFAAIMMICLFSAFIFGSEYSRDKKVGLPRRTGITMFICAFVFPAAVFLLGWLGNIVSPGTDIATNIPGKAVFVFEVIFYEAFFITGTLLPLFYALSEFPSETAWIFKGLKFSVTYFICIWAPVASVMIVLGAALPELLVFLLESFISILFVTVLSDFFFRNFQPTYTSIHTTP